MFIVFSFLISYFSLAQASVISHSCEQSLHGFPANWGLTIKLFTQMSRSPKFGEQFADLIEFVRLCEESSKQELNLILWSTWKPGMTHVQLEHLVQKTLDFYRSPVINQNVTLKTLLAVRTELKELNKYKGTNIIPLEESRTLDMKAVIQSIKETANFAEESHTYELVRDITDVSKILFNNDYQAILNSLREHVRSQIQKKTLEFQLF